MQCYKVAAFLPCNSLKIIAMHGKSEEGEKELASNEKQQTSDLT